MTQPVRVAIVGGGPAGLMAAEAARAGGAAVDLYEGKGSVGRKFLIAGRGGLNLTHSEKSERFIARFGARAAWVSEWLPAFDAMALRRWAKALDVETFIGSSGRVFPADMKAAPLLRHWVHRLRGDGVRFHVKHQWLGWTEDGRGLRFQTPDGEVHTQPQATVLALGGASWPQLGSDGTWVAPLQARGVEIAPLLPANCGFDLDFSAHLVERHAGRAIKHVEARIAERPDLPAQRGEFVLTATGIEGQLVYALSAPLRDQLALTGAATLVLDLAPDRAQAALTEALQHDRGTRSRSEHWRRRAHLDGVRAALVLEVLPRDAWDDPARVAMTIKALPLRPLRPRPIAESISSAGGVRFESLTPQLMLRTVPGVFCAGEMLDWEAPTGGYLLTASMASGRHAGVAAARHAASTMGAALP